jgi:hypothetical protein
MIGISRHSRLPPSCDPQAYGNRTLHICFCVGTSDLFCSSKFSRICNYDVECCGNLWMIYEPQWLENVDVPVRCESCGVLRDTRKAFSHETGRTIRIQQKPGMFIKRSWRDVTVVSVFVCDAEMQTDAVSKLLRCILWLLARWVFLALQKLYACLWRRRNDYSESHESKPIPQHNISITLTGFPCSMSCHDFMKEHVTVHTQSGYSPQNVIYESTYS